MPTPNQPSYVQPGFVRAYRRDTGAAVYVPSHFLTDPTQGPNLTTDVPEPKGAPAKKTTTAKKATSKPKPRSGHPKTSTPTSPDTAAPAPSKETPATGDEE